MAGPAPLPMLPPPTLLPLGDAALLIRFATSLTDLANRTAIGCAQALARDPVPGVVEVVPNLVSVLLRYDPRIVALNTLMGEVRLRLFGLSFDAAASPAAAWTIPTRFGGGAGPDLEEVAAALGLTAEAFVAAHNGTTLRVLATGFAPGFVYCGFHSEALVLPRRNVVRRSVPRGSVLFAAGQTAITATEIPTGWHVIGHTDFANFDMAALPPTTLAPGDQLIFEALA
ncbi:Allophanate hydrolase 2 subunit 1 [Devosia sp. LC5]|uniref:5-oxoprolinase subunit B family protein n=1 Tax=Devosia sp. LC5 TaxID=1502724 RepID=UPI0004E39D0F|nr:carboxyltransferase domain-containing protein [Devosia sp. LC5]KFC72292.1 Allophanate hydrolase 2 subunit 1 [Devosia sp. LC5]